MRSLRRIKRKLQKREREDLARAVLIRIDDMDYVRGLETENVQLSRRDREMGDLDTRRAELCRLQRTFLESVVEAARRARAPAQRIDIERLPRSLPDAIALAQQLYPDRLLFIDRALRSAQSAALNDAPDCPYVAWRVLRAMATVLYDLHERGDSTDVARQFQDTTGLEVAICESSATRQDKRLRNSRLITSTDDLVLDASSHVKFGVRAPRILRVHYAFCAFTRMIVIAHCGDHLETAGSQRL